MKNLFTLILILTPFVSNIYSQQPREIKNTIVAIEKGRFHGWPANNGIWSWGNEILAGYTQVEYDETGGHNIKSGAPQLSLLARSDNGGESWKMFDPENYVGDGGTKKKLEESINFKKDGFALRVFGDKYHGTTDPEAGFYYSYDKGNSWEGPFYLGNIANHPEFEGRILTPRTDYLVLNEKECLIFISSRVPDTGMSDKSACIRTRDGGLSFEFDSWIAPLSDPYRAVMPQTVQNSGNAFVSAIRRRRVDDGDNCWIDAYNSIDGGKTWNFISKVTETGNNNGNPPAMVKLSDGRLCCIFGNRTKREILGKYSSDNGITWGAEFIIRDNFYTGESGEDMKDLGYPRIVQRNDSSLVAIYYWASKENPEQHIAASIWKP